MKMLIIDTTQAVGVAALYIQGSTIEKKEFDSKSQQKILIKTIDNLLTHSNITIDKLTTIAVCIGPGSFTGTRIGVMSAKTFAYALDIPLLSFNSLVPYHTSGTLTILPLKNNECFVYDGALLEKKTLFSLINENKEIFSLTPNSLSFPTKQAIYSFDPILSLNETKEFSLIY